MSHQASAQPRAAASTTAAIGAFMLMESFKKQIVRIGSFLPERVWAIPHLNTFLFVPSEDQKSRPKSFEGRPPRAFPCFPFHKHTRPGHPCKASTGSRQMTSLLTG